METFLARCRLSMGVNDLDSRGLLEKFAAGCHGSASEGLLEDSFVTDIEICYSAVLKLFGKSF